MMQATHFLHMLQKKKKNPKAFLPTPQKKTEKGFRVQTMQLLGEELPCQQPASN